MSVLILEISRCHMGEGEEDGDLMAEVLEARVAWRRTWERGGGCILLSGSLV